MATSIFSNQNWWYSSQYTYGYISTAYDHSRNGSTQNYTIYWSAGLSSGAYYNYGISIYMAVDGNSYYLGGVPANQGKAWYREGNQSISLANKTSGSSSFYVAVYRASDGALLWTSSTYYLTVDPAYPNFTTHSIDSRTETSITVRWGCDSNCDAVQYSLNGGSWANTSGYPTYTISGLSANTSYTIKTRARRTDSGLWGESGTLSTSTYNYPYANSMPDFTIGNSLTIGLYNPLGRSVQVYFIGDNDAEYGGDTTTNTSISGYYNQTWKDRIYSTIPDKSSGKYKVKVVYGSTSTITKSGGTYSITGNEKPTFSNWSFADVNSKTLNLTGSSSIIVKNYSKIRGTISTANKMVANNGANPNFYRLSIGSNTTQSNYSSSSSVNVGDLVATTNKFYMYAVDSRELSTPVEKTASNYKEYSDIVITDISVERAGNVGTETTLTLSGRIWNNNFGSVQNSIKTFKIEYEILGESGGYHQITVQGAPTVAGQAFSYSHIINGDLGASGYTTTKSFNIKATVTDELSTSSKSATLGVGTPNISVAKEGVGINKPYEPDIGGALQVDGKTTIDGDLRVTGEIIGAGSLTGDTLPIGSIIPYSSDTIPTNWLLCNGQAISRTEYSALFSVIGTTYGTGNGSTTFNLPNLKGKVPVGEDTSQTEFNTLGKTGGEKTHTLTINEMPSHHHSEYRAVYTATDGFLARDGAAGNGGGYNSGDTGGNQPHNNLQPYITINYIIKTNQSAGVVAEIENQRSTSLVNTYSCNYINSITEYAEAEKKIGTWIDGKPIYRKVIDIGNLPNNTTKNIAYNISDFGELINLWLKIKTSASQYIANMTGIDAIYSGGSVVARIINNNIQIGTNRDYSSHSGYAIIEYTKTTD